MSHGHTRTHKTHHGPNLGEATTFPLIIFFVLRYGAYTQMSFLSRKVSISQLWRPINFCTDLQLRWGLKQSCSLCRELSKNMWQATYTQVNEGDSWLLLVENQIGNLTSDPSFDHNLCFKYSNGTWEPILDI